MHTFFRILALIFAALFLCAIYLQFSDTDAYLWISAYGVAAVASVAFAFNKLHFRVALLLAAAYFISGFIHCPDTYGLISVKKVGLRNVDEGREALGLFLCSTIMLIYAFRIWFIKIKRPN